MLFTIRTTRITWLLLPLGVALLLLTVACGGAAPATTPTPSPTPTPRPLASQPYLDLGPDATLRQVVDRLPQAERVCVEGRISADDPAWDRPAFQQDGLDPLGETDAAVCLSNQTLTGLLAAGIYHQADGLSPQTMTCIEGTFSGVDLAGMMARGDDEGSPEEFQQLFGSIVALLLCLTDEEAARINLGEATGGGGPDVTLQDLRCVLQRVDVSILMDFFTIAEDPDATPSPENMRRLGQLLEAFTACGVEVDVTVPPGT